MARRKPVIDLTTYSALDAWAISLHEMYKALKRAGMEDSLAVSVILEPAAYPDWVLPKPTLTPYWDDEEDDED